MKQVQIVVILSCQDDADETEVADLILSIVGNAQEIVNGEAGTWSTDGTTVLR